LIWTGSEGFTGYTPNGTWENGATSAPPTEYGPIAPLQSFFVENIQTGEEAGNLQLTFNVNTHSSGATGTGFLKSAAASNDKLTIMAGNGESSVLTFIANREDGQNALSSRDARKLFSEVSELPDIYTLKPADEGLIAVGANIIHSDDIEIPVGIFTSFEGNLTLTFEGMDRYDAQITFIDKQENRTITLTGLSHYEYEFNYLPIVNMDSVAIPTNDRFVIRFTPATLTEIRPIAEQTVNVYSQNGAIHASGAVSNPIRQIVVYNTQGAVVYADNQVNSSVCTTDRQAAGVYVVRLVTEKNVQNVKLIIE
jgi:hypothetical protein